MAPDVSPRPPEGAVPQSFGAQVRRMHRVSGLVVQPRMGFADPAEMRYGLIATRAAAAATVGTLTLDSYTRVGDLAAARRALDQGRPLNGYPLVTHPARTTHAVLDRVLAPEFSVQVRHGSSRPQPIVRAMAAAGLTATEGGPVSYCLPYGRVPLRESVANWAECCELLVAARGAVGEPHVETFGGCMLGQLCPPSLLVALSVLEALFFAEHGIRDLSLSYAQQAHAGQDAEAIAALRRLTAELVPAGQRHLVLYTYMGVYPRTAHGARALLIEAARLAARTGVERLIVKTTAEAHRLPSIEENVQALETAAAAAEGAALTGPPDDTGIYAEARALVERVLDMAADIGLGRSLVRAFVRGYLDVPYCLHPDNAGRTDAYLAPDGRLEWADTGALPIRRPAGRGEVPRGTSSTALLAALNHVADRFDAIADDRLGREVAADLLRRGAARYGAMEVAEVG
jgi:methylaspartate mutase epsilon subunit